MMKAFTQRARDREPSVVIHKATSQFNRQHVVRRQRVKQNSSHSLDEFWAGLDENVAVTKKAPSSQQQQRTADVTTVRADRAHRSKQNSATSLDSFWAGLDEVEFSRQLTGAGGGDPTTEEKTSAVNVSTLGPRRRSSRFKQLSSQTTKTVKWSDSTTTEEVKEDAREAPELVGETEPPPVSFISFENDQASHPELELSEPVFKPTKKNMFRRIFRGKPRSKSL